MKIFFPTIAALLIINMGLFAQNNEDAEVQETPSAIGPAVPETVEVTDTPKEAPKKERTPVQWPSFMRTEDANLSTGYGKQRFFELSAINVGLSNSWFNVEGLVDFLKNRDFLDYNADDFFSRKGFIFETGLNTRLIKLRFNVFSLFTLDFGAGIEGGMKVVVSDDTMKSVKELYDFSQSYVPESTALALPDPPEVSGEVFVAGSFFSAVTLGVEKNFLRDKLKVRVAPSVFVPLLYLGKQEMHLTSSKGDDYYVLGIPEEERSLSAWLISSQDQATGLDFTIEGRYAIWPILDAGMSVENIPIVPAKMRTNHSVKFDVDFKVPVSASGIKNITSPSDIEMQFDVDMVDSVSGTKKVSRPTRFDFYTVIKPFKSHLLLITPDAGFSVNTALSDNTLFNWGVAAQLNLPALLSITAGTRLFEEVWTQYASIAVDLFILEINAGVSLRGPTFAQSWSTHGLGVQFGLKLGF